MFETNIGSVGLTETAAKEAGFRVNALWGSWPDKPDFYPESATITLKMVYDSKSKKLLGLQAAGKGDICRRVDSFSAFLNFGATVYDLLDFEHGYAPPYSEALDPLHHLAGMALAQLENIEFISPDQIGNIDTNSAQIIDVREADEYTGDSVKLNGEYLSGVINIPLMSLRDHTGALDKTRETYIICKRGVRSYQAAVILKKAGFQNIKIIGGGVQALL
jgi:rhodanese-related sulfurtransferase